MVLWSFVDFGAGEFRLTRLETAEGSENVMMDLAAERPWGSLTDILMSCTLSPFELAYEVAAAKQRRERNRT